MGVTYGLPSATPADVWTYAARLLTPPNTAPVDIRLNGGTTQLLPIGWYTAFPTSDAYNPVLAWDISGLHLEIFTGAAWQNWTPATEATFGFGPTFYSDGTNMRAANAAAAGTWLRLVGVRVY